MVTHDPLPAACMDQVCHDQTLHHLIDPEREARRVREGGREWRGDDYLEAQERGRTSLVL